MNFKIVVFYRTYNEDPDNQHESSSFENVQVEPYVDAAETDLVMDLSEHEDLGLETDQLRIVSPEPEVNHIILLFLS